MTGKKTPLFRTAGLADLVTYWSPAWLTRVTRFAIMTQFSASMIA